MLYLHINCPPELQVLEGEVNTEYTGMPISRMMDEERVTKMKKILVVEDDTLLNKTLSYNLSTAGYDVDSVMSVEGTRKYTQKKEYDLIVLDVNLPDGSGFQLCKEIKSNYENMAIVFLTAHDMESDMLKGFELGADDYITKPFPVSVFLKKVAAILGRMSKQAVSDYFDDGNLFIDLSEMTAALAGNPIFFTPMEYRTLKVFIRNSKIVLTRQVLLEKLWDADENFVDEHALTSNISRIRSKIETADNQYIKTVYGMGYMWIGGVKK